MAMKIPRGIFLLGLSISSPKLMVCPSQLVCPIDVHVSRVAARFGLITRKQTDWLTALELTRNLKLLDHLDPARYDFALFGLGVVEKY